MNPARTTPWWAWLTFVLLLATFAILALAASPRKSASFDEQYHLTSGYAYAKTGDSRLATTHPPLVGLLAALPLLRDAAINLPLDDPNWQAGDRFAFSDIFLWYAGNDAPSLLVRGRWAVVVLGLCTVAVVYLWGRRLFGVWGALLALWLAALDPNLIANARLITTDMGVTLFTLIVLWRLWAWLEGGGHVNVLWAGLAAGAAMGSKYNGLLLWPIVAVVLICCMLRVRRMRTAAAGHVSAPWRPWVLPHWPSCGRSTASTSAPHSSVRSAFRCPHPSTGATSGAHFPVCSSKALPSRTSCSGR